MVPFVRGSKDRAFAMKPMGKYFRTDDRDVLEETYEAVIKSVFNFPPYPVGVPALLQEVEKQHPKAKNARPKILSTRILSASSITMDLLKRRSRSDRFPCSRDREFRKTDVSDF